MKRLLITGSRAWTDIRTIHEALTAAHAALASDGEEVILVSGACNRGADRFAEGVWLSLGYAVERHPAQWRPHGIYNPHAGKYRNKVMVDAGADLCLAFIKAGSGGASHCARLAEEAGIAVLYFRED